MSAIRQIQVDGINYDLVITEDEISATAAAQSAAEAAQSATQAAGSATTASGHASAAASSANNAEGYAQQASNAVSSVATYSQSASNSANSASSSASSASTAANNASGYSTAAETFALNAEAAAAGTRNGTAVTSGDPFYHNNAKYWRDDAATSASTALGYKNSAETAATSASGSATTASNEALDAEAVALGTRNGTPVSSSDPYYQNNAKYYKDQAQAIVGPAAPINSPAFTGTPTTPDLTSSSTDSQITNKKYVDNAISGITHPVTSVNNKTGAVTLNASDVGALPSSTTIPPGTVTSVRVQATSPVTSSTDTAQSSSLDTTIGLATAYGDTQNPYGSKTANYVLAAPNGSAGNPSFRALVAADIPNLDTGKLNSGTLSVARGGTGAGTFTSGAALIGAGTGAVTTRSITNITATSTALTANTNLITANTLKNIVNRTTSVAAADTNYTTYMARGTTLNSTDTNPTVNGTIAWTYE